MSISNLFTKNDYSLYSKSLTSDVLDVVTQNVQELITDNINTSTLTAQDAVIEKIRSVVGGASLSVYNPLNSYNTGDIVFYHGCIFTSLIDNNSSEPTQISPDWMKVSNVKNDKLFLVNKDFGDDEKAMEECSNYPFKNLDNAYLHAVSLNPTGGFMIYLQAAGDNIYDFTQDITSNNVLFTCNRLEQVIINTLNTITVTGTNVGFTFLQVRGIRPAGNTDPLIINESQGALYFDNCTINYKGNNQYSNQYTAIYLYPNNVNFTSNVYTVQCGFSGATTKFTISDKVDRKLLGGNMVMLNNNNICVIEDLAPNNIDTTIGTFRVAGRNGAYKHLDNYIAWLDLAEYAIYDNLTSNLNSPGKIFMKNVSFFAGNSNQTLYDFNKLGTAEFYLIDVDRNRNNTFNPSLLPGSFDRTSGPQYDYVSANTYQQNDVAIYQGRAYKCLVNNTINITPEYTSPNWATLTPGAENQKLYFVNKSIGSDTKATTENYPFETLDAAYLHAVSLNPTGGFAIYLQSAGDNNYEFTQDITVNRVYILSTDENYKININLPNPISILGQFVVFRNVRFTAQRTTPNPTEMMTLSCGFVCQFYNCELLYSVDGSTTDVYTAIHVKPNASHVSWILMEKTNFVGAKTKFTISDSATTYFIGGSLTFESCITEPVIEELVPVNVSTVIGGFRVFMRDGWIKYISNHFSKILMYNTTFVDDFTSNLDSPGNISLNNCTFFSYTNVMYNFYKLGTAEYYLTDVLMGDLSSVTPSALSGSFDKTSGPRYDYRSGNTYNVNDLVVSDGELYSCLVNNTLNIQPGETTSTNWLSLSKFNQPTAFGTPGTLTVLSTGLTNTADKLNIPTLVSDPFDILGTVGADSFIINYTGLYEIDLNIESQTTTTTGQNELIDIFINLSSTSDISSALARNTMYRGLVNNSTNYPTNNVLVSFKLPWLVVNTNPLSIYARNTNNQSFNIQIVKMSIMRVRKV